MVKSRGLAALPAFLASSLMHDFHLGIAMGFFTPIFLIMFAGIGGLLLRMTLSVIHDFQFKTQVLCFLFGLLQHGQQKYLRLLAYHLECQYLLGFTQWS